MTPQKNHQEARRFIKFSGVGVINTLIDFGLMNLFSGVFRWPLIISQALSFLIAVANSYILNRRWVYSDLHTSASGTQFSKFLLINLAGLGIRSVSINPLEHWFYLLLPGSGMAEASALRPLLSRNLALALIIPVTLLLNFLANRYWTFRAKPAAALPSAGRKG